MNLTKIAKKIASDLQLPSPITERLKDFGVNQDSLKYIGSGIHGAAYKSGSVV